MNYEGFTMVDPETHTDVNIPHLFLSRKQSRYSTFFLFFRPKLLPKGEATQILKTSHNDRFIFLCANIFFNPFIM